MEKLFSTTFNNGRSLDGLMRSHLATLPLPPPPPPPPSEDERSRQNRKLAFGQNSDQKKFKQSLLDTSSEEVAITLMMLSRDKWKNNVGDKEKAQKVERSMGIMEEINFRKVGGRQKCDKCGNNLRSSRALECHKIICVQNEANLVATTSSSDHKIFQCMICSKVFGSGQALGGHKRSHFYPSLKKKLRYFDLNLPPSSQEDGTSVLFEA